MRQRRWAELLSDYEGEIRYHPRKSNGVADALSHKKQVKSILLTCVLVQNNLEKRILDAQHKSVTEGDICDEMSCGAKTQLETKPNGLLYFHNRLWFADCDDLRTLVMDEAHKSRYSIHPGADKMYADIRCIYWWPIMKKQIALYVSKCLRCSKVKAE
ncbi:uncharacterized protein LOC143591910 [Bidens hawaiensis]|uniref:uncharacterized protein LOC143591910 n=1 Tax=Bidens hawaiensis TaxID=980011 RepID=UPI00404B7A78